MEVVLLAAISAVAGLVYGFAGFGAALIAVPLYAQIVGPVAAVALLAIGVFGSALTVLPAAMREADRRACTYLLIAALAGLPLGALVLDLADPEAIRWAMSLIVLGTLALLVAGFRIRRAAGPAAWLGIGALVGIAGGSTGLNGPPLVLFQLAGPDGARRSRANTITVLSLTSLALSILLFTKGTIGSETVWLGLALTPIYGGAGYLGRRLFAPERETLYRGAAFAIIGAAGVAGLPIWG